MHLRQVVGLLASEYREDGMGKRALITWGGWDGHQPDKVAALFAELLRAEGFEVEVHDTLACFDDAARLKTLDLIVPIARYAGSARL